MRVLRALGASTLVFGVRLHREGIIVRSLVFPAGIVVAALVATVLAVSWLRPPNLVVALEDDPVLRAALEDEGYQFAVSEDPHADALAQRAAIGIAGDTMWVADGGAVPTGLEAVVREHLGARWIPWESAEARDRAIRERPATGSLVIVLSAIFSLYGVVVGVGGIARDRTEGTLDAELSTAVPRWVFPLSRWIGGTAVLGLYLAWSIALVHAVIGVPDPVRFGGHAIAASSAAVAVGLLVSARARIDRGFAAPLSAGLVGVASLGSATTFGREAAQWIPVASLRAYDTSPLAAMGTACLLGIAASVLFARRVDNA